MAIPGDPIELDIVLFDFDDSKHVRAQVDADGVPLAGSPFTVPNVGNGRYFLIDMNNLTFPNDRFEVNILYEVFNDAGFTDRSKKHGPSRDNYRLDQAPQNTNPDLLRRLDRIIALISELKVLDGEFLDEVLEGQVIPNEVSGNMDEDTELIGVVVTEDQISGLLSDSDLEGLF